MSKYRKTPENRGLSPKEKQFAIEYVACNVGKTAAIKAGYSKKTAESQASRLLTRVKVKAFVDELRKAQEDKTLVTAEYVIKGIKEVAERCMQRKPVMEFDPVDKCMKQKTVVNEQGEEIGLWEFDSTGANKSLEMLGKHVDIFKGSGSEAVEVTVIIKNEP